MIERDIARGIVEGYIPLEEFSYTSAIPLLYLDYTFKAKIDINLKEQGIQ